MIRRLFALLLLSTACATAPIPNNSVASGQAAPSKPSSQSSLSAEEYSKWKDYLLQQPEIDHRLRKAEDREQALSEEIKILRVLLRRHRRLCSDQERAEIRRDARDAAVFSSYRREILKPRVQAGLEEAREIFKNHASNYRHSRGVFALEIFLWAPEDLPELRLEKSQLIHRLAETCQSVEDFRDAARKYSDATSAFRGGAIGTIEENQVSGPVRDTLFFDKTGLSELLEAPQGFYLFFITRLIPAKTSGFEDVADRIIASLKVRRLNALAEKDQKKLEAQMVIHEAPGDPLLEIGSETFSAEDLLLTHPNREQIRRRGLALLETRILASRGIEPAPIDPMALDWRISRIIFRRLLEKKLEDPSWPPDEMEGPRPTFRSVERWSFDLLSLDKADRPKLLYQVFRVLYETGDEASLESIRTELEKCCGLKGEIRHFEKVLPSDVAGLGPEIHTTLKGLKPGESSHPLQPSRTHRLVIVRMLAKTEDPEAAVAARTRADQARRRKLGHEKLREELLAEVRAPLVIG